MKHLTGFFLTAVLLSPLSADPFIVDHTNLHLYDEIPAQYITAAQNLRMMWGDRSVGGNINEGLNCLSYETDELAPSHCRRNHTEAAYMSPASEIDWNIPGGLNRSNWTFFFDPGLGVTTEYTCPNYSEGQFDWIGCFIDFARRNIDSYDVISYQHSYLTIMPGSNITSPDFGYFVNRANGTDIYDFERMESDYTTKRFFYWTTSLSRGLGSQEGVDYNNAMRQFAITRNKVLFDVADIESHDPWGNPCYDNRDGVPYSVNGTLRENYPDDGLNLPAICQHYTGEHDGGHLGNVSVGKIRLAKAYWIVMAYLAGWRPGTTPPPVDTQAPSNPSSLSAASISSTQINLTWTASTDNTGVTGYRVERCAGAGCSSFSQVATVGGPSFSNTGLSPSTTYRFRVRAADAAGNLSGYSNIAEAVTPSSSDTTAPSVTVTFPANGATVSGVVTITANASDNVGVTGVQFMVDGLALGPEDASAPYSAFWDTLTYPNAVNTVSASARDAAGNVTVSSAITVTVLNSTASCDLNSDAATNVTDVQICANQCISVTACTNGDINRDGSCNVVDVQRVVNAALGGTCVSP